MMQENTHRIKIKSQYFSAVAKGLKTFEIRYNDRQYKVGDKIILQEIDRLGSYTGQEIQAFISYLTDYEQKEHFVVFSFKKIIKEENECEATKTPDTKNKRGFNEQTFKPI
ncbi:TPA: DUF3850 domain-containing protein [Enterococcus hirae]